MVASGLMRIRFVPALLLFLLEVRPVPAIVVSDTTPNGWTNSRYGASSYTGVVRVNQTDGFCTGSLFGPSRIYVLTAAHCVTDAAGNVNPIANATIGFDTPSGQTLDPFAAIYVAPGYTGANSAYANDLAVIQIQNAAPSDAAVYSLYANLADIGKDITLVGHGSQGNGLLGAVLAPSTDPAGRLQGLNTYDTDQLVVGGETTHAYWDFDDGTTSHNAFAGSSLGHGLNEVSIAPGDSGGPSFYQGRIVGVHSYVTCYTSRANPNGCVSPPDVFSTANGPQFTFGEIGADTRVALYADNFLAPFDTSIPEPGTWGLCAVGAALLVGGARLRRATVP